MWFRCIPLLVPLLITTSIDAVPVADPRPKFFTAPLTRIQHPRGVHPLIYHQQMANRAVRRLCRMTGRSPPPDHVLAENLRKRIVQVEAGTLEKRFNRFGTPVSQASAGSPAAGPQPGKSFAAKNDTQSSDIGGPDSKINVTVGEDPKFNNSLALAVDGQDVGYLFTMTIGTPTAGSAPKQYALLADSGSADLWVASETCVSTAGGGCGNHQTLGNQSSTSFKSTGIAWKITYGTGAVNGTKVTDDVTIGGLQLKNHNFGVGDFETDDFTNDTTPFDGIAGLAKSTISEQKVLTPIEALAKSKLVDSPITSYKLARVEDGINDSEITFGGRDPSKFDKTFQVDLPCIADDPNLVGFWAANMDAVTVNGNDANCNGRSAILDTGTTLIIAPSNDVTNVHKQIDGSQSLGQGAFAIPCDTNATVALKFGNKPFEINAKDLAFVPLDTAGKVCLSGIMAGDVGGANTWLVGDVFLKNVYFTTDVQKDQITLAKLA